MTAYAALTLQALTRASNDEVVDQLLRSDAVSGFTQVAHNQIMAWRQQLDLMRKVSGDLTAVMPELAQSTLVLEYRIPRREKRIDALLLLRRTIVLIEFKVGAERGSSADVDQVLDYALDVAHYHEESRGRVVKPVLCATNMATVDTQEAGIATVVDRLTICGAAHLAEQILNAARQDAGSSAPPLDAERWVRSAYRPIPGIVEATIRLFRAHDVEDIKSSLAEQGSIAETVSFIDGLVRESQSSGAKILCLLTGVPGAGKTLAGLQIAHLEGIVQADWLSVFMSGNGPLLKVLKAALTRDYAKRQGVNLNQARLHADSQLHSVHAYLAETRTMLTPPVERLVVFDEAQRAWDAAKMQKMATRAVRMGGSGAAPTPPSSQSEPWQILDVLNRHTGGAVLVALCGNGQEIHDGEAGVAEWVSACRKGFPDWRIVCSAVAAELASEKAPQSVGLFDQSSPGARPATKLEVVDKLHLHVPIRAHRANQHAKWIDAVLGSRPQEAAACVDHAVFPISFTRDLEVARDWLWRSTLGSRRCGLLASSGGARLRPYGVEVSAEFRKGIDYALWFTAERDDLRSSHSLEVAATEFECQGLELDWAGVCWSWDMPVVGTALMPRALRASKAWLPVKSDRERAYVANKYRVLLSRAREGMIIWVPKGQRRDPTRSPKEADDLAAYLRDCGVRELQG